MSGDEGPWDFSGRWFWRLLEERRDGGGDEAASGFFAAALRMTALFTFSRQERALELGEDQADAAYDVVGRSFVSGEGKKLDGKIARVWTKDETAFVEVDEAEQERSTAANGVEGGLVSVLGIGQPGRLANLEERVERHERSVQRMKGLVGAAGGLLTVFHLAVDYFRR